MEFPPEQQPAGERAAFYITAPRLTTSVLTSSAYDNAPLRSLQGITKDILKRPASTASHSQTPTSIASSTKPHHDGGQKRNQTKFPVHAAEGKSLLVLSQRRHMTRS